MTSQLQETIYSDDIEVWLSVPDFEGFYEVSNLGRVKSLSRFVNINNKNFDTYLRKEKILKHGILRDYSHVSLCKDGKIKQFKVHRLVLMAFKPVDNYENLEGNHLDGIKQNNKLSNLEWNTNQENQIHRHNVIKCDNKTSKYPYIFKINENKWRLRGYKNIHLGYFKTEYDAFCKMIEINNESPEVFNNIDLIKYIN